MERRIELEDLMKEIGLKNLTNFVIGCERVAMILNELPAAEKMHLRTRLTEALTEADIPFAGRFLLEVINKGLDKLGQSPASHTVQ